MKLHSIPERLSKTAIRVANDATWVLVIVIVLSLVSSAFSIHYLSSLQADIDELYENEVKGQTYAQNAYVAVVEIESEVKDLVLSEAEDMRRSSSDGIAKNITALQGFVRRASLTLSATRYRRLIANTTRDVSALADALRNRLDIEIPTQQQGHELLNEIAPIADSLKNDIVTMNDIKRTANRTGLRAIQIQLQVSLATSIVILMVSIAIRLFLYHSSKRIISSKAEAAKKRK